MQRAELDISLAPKRLLCLWLVIAADWLFYAEPVGWTAGLYAAIVLVCLCLAHRKLLSGGAGQLIALLMAGLCAVMVDNPSPLPFYIFCAGAATLLVLSKRKSFDNAVLWLKDLCWFTLRIPRQWWRDIRMAKRARAKGKGPARKPFRVLSRPLFLTLCLSGVFCWLFAQANPVISHAFGLLDWGLYVGSLFSPQRWLMWGGCGMLAWALLRPRSRLAAPVTASLSWVDLRRWVDRNSLVYSLALFNIIFAVQNGLDIAFLWNGEGKQLPDGMTFAEYAHAGAYPLIVTALLAAGYVLITFDTHQKQYRTRAAVMLVTLWVAQNIFLVVSSIDRTLLYIGLYSLTYLRVAALVWMGLVGFGLAAIIARIFAARSNMWLVNANALALAAVLYSCCFVDFERMIANYNVHHAREVTGMGAELDLDYINALGPEAIPALRWFSLNGTKGWNLNYIFEPKPGETFEEHWSAENGFEGVKTVRAANMANAMEKELRANVTNNWRSWTWQRQHEIDHLQQRGNR